MTKLTDNDLIDINDRHMNWENLKDLAIEYGVTKEALYMQRTRRMAVSWRAASARYAFEHLKYCHRKWYLNDQWMIAYKLLEDMIF